MGWSWSVFDVIGYERLGLGGEKGSKSSHSVEEGGYDTEGEPIVGSDAPED